jgi:hypothetical protein
MSNPLPMVAALAVLFLGGAAVGDWLAEALGQPAVGGQP